MSYQPNSPQANLPRWPAGSQIASINEVIALINSAVQQNNTSSTSTVASYIRNTTQGKLTPIHAEGANGAQTIVEDDAI